MRLIVDIVTYIAYVAGNFYELPKSVDFEVIELNIITLHTYHSITYLLVF